jgi:hypothetical protein
MKMFTKIWHLFEISRLKKALMQLHEETSFEKQTQKSSDSEPRLYSYLDLDSVPWRVVHRKLACLPACLVVVLTYIIFIPGALCTTLHSQSGGLLTRVTMLTGVPTPTSTPPPPPPPPSSCGDACLDWWMYGCMDGYMDGWIIIIMNQCFFFSNFFCILINPKNWENFVSLV